MTNKPESRLSIIETALNNGDLKTAAFYLTAETRDLNCEEVREKIKGCKTIEDLPEDFQAAVTLFRSLAKH